jgi:hypothetical protein
MAEYLIINTIMVTTYRGYPQKVRLPIDHIVKLKHGVVLALPRVLTKVRDCKKLNTLWKLPFERSSATDLATDGFSATQRANLFAF